MPVLLESIADQQVSYMLGLSRSFDSECLDNQVQTETQSTRELAINARVSARSASTCVFLLSDLVLTVEDALRDGINGNSFRHLVSACTTVLQTCQKMIVSASNRIECLHHSDISVEARIIIEEATSRLKEPETKILYWKKLAERRPPEIDPALIARGAEQIRQGQFKTPEQALEIIRGNAQ
jgi:hypothetical protein